MNGPIGEFFPLLRREPLACSPAAAAKELGIDRGAQRQAKGLLVVCPAHSDRTPSCSITQGRDGTLRCRCFACGWTGDVVGLFCTALGLNKREALAEIARWTGRRDVLEVIEGREGPRHFQRTTPVRPAPVAPEEPARLSDAGFHCVARALLDVCPLRRQEDVCAYLYARGLFADAECVQFAALPTGAALQHVVAELVERCGAESLERAGLLREGRFAWSAHRLIIPWFNADGSIGAIQRRRIVDGAKPKYVFTPGRAPREPFGSELFATATRCTYKPEIIVTEGALDCLARRRLARRNKESHPVVLGIPSVTIGASYEWAPLVAGRDVVICFDVDQAGDAAVARFEARFEEAASLTRERSEFGKDAGDALVRELAS